MQACATSYLNQRAGEVRARISEWAGGGCSTRNIFFKPHLHVYPYSETQKLVPKELFGPKKSSQFPIELDGAPSKFCSLSREKRALALE